MDKLWIVIVTVCCFASCSYTEKLQNGDEALARKQYAVAANFFKKDFEKAKNTIERGRLAWLTGECYRLNTDFVNAADWYQKAYNDHYTGAAYRYGLALKQSEQYKEAANVFREAGQEIGSVYEYQSDIQACKVAEQWVKDVSKNPYKVENTALNTPAAEFSPVYGKENGTIWFTSDRASAEEKTKFGWTNRAFSDIFISNNIENNDSEKAEATFNTPWNDASVTFSGDYSEAVFVRCGTGNKKTEVEYCQLFYSKIEDGKWTEPQAINLGNDQINYGSPALTADGKALFFSSDNPDGFGGYDLYLTYKLNEGGWAAPRNLGNGINTKGNEQFPFADKDTLYFSSNGQIGMGGLDIFKAVKKDGKYGNVTNMRTPINSGYDDFGFVLDTRFQPNDKVLQKGFLASNRLGGKGSDDIYSFQKVVPPPVPVDTTPKPLIVYKILLDGFTREKDFLEADNPNSPVSGYKELANVAVTVTTEDTSFTLKSSAKGTFAFELKENRDYRFTAVKDGYFKGNGYLTTRELFKDPANPVQTLRVEITLDKIFKDKEIVLENIYYDFDKWDIRQDARPALDRLSEILKDNPTVNIELASHTDCRGNDGYNLSLSQKRAESVVQYLIARGIARERLSARGYGETSPIETCDCRQCTEEQHQANRRTTFKVI